MNIAFLTGNKQAANKSFILEVRDSNINGDLDCLDWIQANDSCT